MMQEYAYITKEKNKMLDKKNKDEDGEIEGVDYEWVELPSFDNPEEMIRYKQYKDIAGKNII